MQDGTTLVDALAVANAHPLGTAPFGRDDYIRKFRVLADGVVSAREANRFIAVVQELPGLTAGELHRELASLLPTAFGVTETIRVETTNEIGVADLAQRVLTFSSSSPAALGEKVDPMLRDVEARLMPFSHDGVVKEIVVSTAQIARRR